MKLSRAGVCKLLLLCGLSQVIAQTPAKPALEPICVALEPKVLATRVSHELAGSRKTILTPAAEKKDGLMPLDLDAWKALNLTWEEYLAKATEAATRHLATLTPEVHKDQRGTISFIKLHNERHLTSSVILSPELWKKFSPQLGTSIVALVPDRFTVLLFPRQSGAFVKQGPEVATLFTDATYPASDEAFEISETSFKSIGNFTTGDPE